MKKYQHIFFDLDHTLWDFDKNSEKVLINLYKLHNLGELGSHGSHQFLKIFKQVNRLLWNQLDRNKITVSDVRKQRFKMVFKELGLDSSLIPIDLERQYLELCPQGGEVIPYAHETLTYLNLNYSLHIITNGFQAMQRIKLVNAKLDQFFDEIITVDVSGYRKPSPHIFNYALEKAGTSVQDSLMIGDNLETDILGAQAAYMDHIYFNPESTTHYFKVTHEITCLSELKELL